jgi:hypothetical protein
MSGFPILDLVVGMIFIYFLLSIISSSVVELILTLSKTRAKLLQKWLLTIFDKQIAVDGEQTVPLGQAIMNHCTTTALSGQGSATSYMDAKNFTSALIEKLTFIKDQPKKVVTDLGEVIDAISKSEALSPELKRVFILYANGAIQSGAAEVKSTFDKFTIFRNKIENWYDTSMERVSGHLKSRFAFPLTILVASVVASLGNADSIELAKYLHRNPEITAKIAAQGYLTGKDSTNVRLNHLLEFKAINAKDTLKSEEIERNIKDAIATINEAKAVLSQSLPLGWNNVVVISWPMKILGILVSIFAIIMGAPFWFELLNKIANLRGTGAKPATSSKQTG